jgi:catalase
MQVGENGGENPNYRPNSFDDIIADKNYKEQPMPVESNIADWFNRNENDDDHYTQPGILYRKVLSDYDRNNLVSNIVSSMNEIEGEKKNEIINRQLCHFFRIDSNLGVSVAKGLGVVLSDKMINH